MEKTSKIINLVTILIGLVVAVLAYLLLSSVDQIRRDSAAKQTEVDEAQKALAEAKESGKRDISALRGQKSGLTDDLEDHRDQTARSNLSLPEKQAELEGLTKQQEAARLATEKRQAEMTAIEAEVARITEEINALGIGNPAGRATLEQMRNDVQEQNDLTSDIQLELRDYKTETDHLRAHYTSILQALETDADNPSWITIGKSVSTRIERLSMEAGMLVLPLGTTHGMRDEMRFFVSKKGRRVGQLVIKDAGLAHSVANIVPLIGTPTKLKEQDAVEITGF